MQSQAMDYARKCISDPDDKMFTVEGIAEDYLEGAIAAWELLNNKNVSCI